MHRTCCTCTCVLEYCSGYRYCTIFHGSRAASCIVASSRARHHLRPRLELQIPALRKTDPRPPVRHTIHDNARSIEFHNFNRCSPLVVPTEVCKKQPIKEQGLFLFYNVRVSVIPTLSTVSTRNSFRRQDADQALKSVRCLKEIAPGGVNDSSSANYLLATCDVE